MAAPERERGLLDGLWRSPGHHHRADGTETAVSKRPVPSAGATYPVNTHLVVGTGDSALEPGRYVHNLEDGALLRRNPSHERQAGWNRSETSTGMSGTHLVLTVQPGRSFGRYRHRAWPLWIADTAYALAAVEFLSTVAPGSIRLGPGPWLRELLGVPRAAEPKRWLARGLAPEIPLAAVELPASWTVDPERRDALAVRRSPALTDFENATGADGPRAEGAEDVARASGQAWVLGAPRLETWSVATGASLTEFTDILWWAHRRAARICYTGALSGRWRCRPVSGFVAAHDRWIVHALAMLPGTHELDEETDA